MQEKPRNIRRIWKVDVYGSWGDGGSATTYICSHTVTLEADDKGRLSAAVDGEPQDSIDRAVGLLEDRDNLVTLVAEQRLIPENPLPVIGKARASVLHKIMGMVGLPKPQHYAICAAALAEPWPLESLASLNEVEAHTVWAHLCRVHPSAREVAQRLKPSAPLPAAA